MVSRQTTSTTVGRHLASIIFPSSSENFDLTDALGETYGRFNLNELQNALLIANDQVVVGSKDSTLYPQIEIRGFVLGGSSSGNTDTGALGAIDASDAMSVVEQEMDSVRSWFLNPRGLYSSDDQRFANLTSFFTNKALSPSNISTNSTPLVFGNDLKVNNAYQRLPKEEVYSLVDGNNPEFIQFVVEVVLIFGVI